MFEPPSMERIQYNNWLNRQANLAPVDNDWLAEQRGYFESTGMNGYRPNSSFVPGVSAPQEFNRSSGVGIDVPEEAAPTDAQMFLNGLNPNFGDANGEWEEKTKPVDTERKQQSNAMFASIQDELRRYDDGTYQYAMSVLKKLPSVFARYENADPSRAMPYFLAGQPGRQRETEMVRFNDFMR